MLGVVAMATFAALPPTPSAGAQPMLSHGEAHAEEVLDFEQMKAPRWLVEAVVRAAQVTGADPAYMMALADKESSLLPVRKARTSSAEGLFQYLETTWFEVLRRFGSKHGFVAAAEAIQIVRGRTTVANQKDRAWILGLRRDPYLSALMTGEMINTHRQTLAGKVVRDPSFTELYIAHFMGVRGATRLVELLGRTPKQSAPRAFPRAAKANRSLFYQASQSSKVARPKALSVAELHGRVNAMIDQRLARYMALR
jgi:hypothetical protein